jgi:hypothetical protein
LALIAAACGKTDKETQVPKGNYELKEVKLYSDKVTVSVPKDFELMTDEMKQVKYPAGNPPEFVYTDAEGTVNVAINVVDNPLTEKDIEPLVEQMKSMYKAAASEWIDSGKLEVNKKTYGFVEFKIKTPDGAEVYNYIYFTDYDGKMFMGTFNSVTEKLDDWKPTAKEVLYSIKL